MKPSAFEYIVPKTVDDAVGIMAQHGDQAKVLAGGQSLVPAMNFRLVQPSLLVDLNQLDDLRYIRLDETGTLRVGAMTTQRVLEFDPMVAKSVPLLSETMPWIAHPQIRNRGTLGGSLVHADPAAELPVIAVATGAQMKMRSTSGERWVAAEEFFEGMFMTALLPEEVLVEVQFPHLPPKTGTSFMEITRRSGDYAMMGIAAALTLDEDGSCTAARLVFLNAGDGPMRAPESEKLLEGHVPSEEGFAAAAEKAARDEIDPMGSVHATIDYQRHLAQILGVRALQTAYQRAQVQ